MTPGRAGADDGGWRAVLVSGFRADQLDVAAIGIRQAHRSRHAEDGKDLQNFADDVISPESSPNSGKGFHPDPDSPGRARKPFFSAT